MYEYQCKVVKVVDGDTVDVDIDLGFGVWLRDERVRLYGIDTPESRTSDDIEKIYGFAAKEYLERYLSAGNIVLKTKTYDAKGKFGRILGELWAFDTNINERMVEENHAVRYEGQSKKDIKEAHLKNRAKLGLHTIQSFEE
tara:strand:+ start:3757 stop:4179 length:423 start_codon:yes stop_codon:yes gene_type:complete